MIRMRYHLCRDAATVNEPLEIQEEAYHINTAFWDM